MYANLVHFVCTVLVTKRFFLGSRVRGPISEFVAQWTDFEASWRHTQTVSYAETRQKLLNQSREAARKFSGS